MSRIYKIIRFQIILFFLLLLAIALFAQETRQLAVDKPLAIADLKTAEGAAILNARWFVQNAHVVNADFKTPGPGTNGDQLPLYPTGTAIKTHQLHPKSEQLILIKHLKQYHQQNWKEDREQVFYHSCGIK